MSVAEIFSLGRSAALGGMVWHAGRLIVASPDDSSLLEVDPRNGRCTILRRFTGRASALAAGGDGSIYGGQLASRRVVEFRPGGSTHGTAPLLDGAYHNMPVDICIDRNESIWLADALPQQASFGPQLFPYLPHASVLQLTRGTNHKWALRRVTFDTRAPTAVAVSIDARTLYVSEGGASDAVRELRAYPIVADGTVGPYRTLHTFGSDASGAHRGVSGMCTLPDGSIAAVAGWRRSGPGPQVLHFDPQGRLIRSVNLPEDLPSKCCVSPEGTLYVATATGKVLAVPAFAPAA